MGEGNLRIFKRLPNYDSIAFQRAKLQSELSQKLRCFPNIVIELKNNEIIQYCEVIKKSSINKSKHNLFQVWLDFEKEIDTMHHFNYIHGDILLKNIIFDGQMFRLIDHELQLRNGNKLQVTYPWIDYDDFVNKLITYKTDMICMKATHLRLFDFEKYVTFRNDQINILKQITYQIHS